MGYDMYWREVDDDEATAVAVAREMRNAALAERNALPMEEKGTLNMERAKELGPFALDARDGMSDRYRAAQEKVLALSDAMDEAQRSYFRLNIFGMGRYREAMWQLGMVFDAGEHPGWPKPEEYGLTWDDIERVRYEDGPAPSDETQAKAREFIARGDEIRAWHGPEVPGIPVHKFGSNDGWIVLPAECQAALDIYLRKLEEIGEEAMHNFIDNTTGNRGYWPRWLAYLNGAITHGGFEVH